MGGTAHHHTVGPLTIVVGPLPMAGPPSMVVGPLPMAGPLPMVTDLHPVAATHLTHQAMAPMVHLIAGAEPTALLQPRLPTTPAALPSPEAVAVVATNFSLTANSHP